MYVDALLKVLEAYNSPPVWWLEPFYCGQNQLNVNTFGDFP